MIKAEVVFDDSIMIFNGYKIHKDYDYWEISKNGLIIKWWEWTDTVGGWSLEHAIKYCLEN